MAKKEGWPLERDAWDDLLAPRVLDMFVGATQADSNVFPDGFGIGRRNAPRNDYLGIVLTRLEPEVFVVGVNYFDHHDDGDNEDMYKFDLAKSWITPYMGLDFEKEHPQYAG